ncbi:hypothetical protein WME91_52700 [Sorangium sp. So ce269]
MTGAAGGERSRLVRALALSRRFHLYLARCASPRAADGLVAALSDELPRLGRAESRLVRLEPYSGRTEDAPLTDGELADRVLLPLLDPPEELCGAIHLVDASRAPDADTEAWARLFALWNEKRNVLGPSRGEVVVMLPSGLVSVFAAAAPDVWSIRSGEYAVEDNVSLHKAGPEVPPQGSVASVGVAGVALPSLAATSSGSVNGCVDDTLLLVRAVPPLALFGGDLVVRPWVEDLLSAAASREISEPSRGDKTKESELAPFMIARRELRKAWNALAFRRFKAAEQRFSELIEGADGDVELTVGALSGLAIALAAQDRATEAAPHARSALLAEDDQLLAAPLDVMVRAVRTNALVYWCLGHLGRADECAEKVDPHEHAEQVDPTLATHVEATTDVVRSHLLLLAARSRLLRLVERGHVAAARAQVSGLLGPGPHASALRRESVGVDAITRTVLADLEFLSGNLELSVRLFDRALSESSFWPDEHASLARRCEVASALVEIARGNERRAWKLLGSLTAPRDAQAPLFGPVEPEGGFRADAFHAVVSGLLALTMGKSASAATWFENARGFVAAWGRLGLDRRARLRAQLFVELLRTALLPEGDGAVAAARDLTRRADALLGDTAEDHVSRVLAVAAYRELAQRLASAGAGDARSAAQRAAALAQPLGGLGVPAWDELLHAAGRSV